MFLLIIDCLVYFRFIHSLLLARLAELIVQRGDTCLRVCVLESQPLDVKTSNPTWTPTTSDISPYTQLRNFPVKNYPFPPEFFSEQTPSHFPAISSENSHPDIRQYISPRKINFSQDNNSPQMPAMLF